MGSREQAHVRRLRLHRAPRALLRRDELERDEAALKEQRRAAWEARGWSRTALGRLQARSAYKWACKHPVTGSTASAAAANARQLAAALEKERATVEQVMD